MADEKPVLPALKDSAWSGASGCVSRRLAEELDSPYLPWLAYGYDHPHSFEFLSREDFEEMDVSLAQLEELALRNLGARKASWTRSDVRIGWLKKLRLLVCEDDYLAAERVLEPGFMREAHLLLKADLLAVGIPRKGILVATDGRSAKRALGLFAAMVSTQYHRADTAPISPMVFAVAEGAIVGKLAGGEELGKKLAAAEAELDGSDGEGGADDIYVSGLVVAEPESGLEEIVICVGGEEVVKLIQTIQTATLETFQKRLPDERFGGKIRIVVFGGMTPDTPEVRGALAELETRLNGFAGDSELRTVSGRPVQIRFEWKEDTLALA